MEGTRIEKSPAEIEGRRKRLAEAGLPVGKKAIAVALGVGSHPDSGRVVVSKALHGHDRSPHLLRRIDQYLDQVEQGAAATQE